MNKINLQEKTKAEKGTAEMFWFENEFVNLEKTLFHRIIVPLKAFDSGLKYETQLTETEIYIDWLELNLKNPNDLDGLNITSETHKKIETSVYVGGAHNWCDVTKLSINKINNNTYSIDCHLFIDFKNEGVAENENFIFKTTIEFIS